MGVTSAAITPVRKFVKIGQLVQKFKFGDTHTLSPPHRQHIYLISLRSFLKEGK
jgi:hypothetical protein